MAINNNTKLVDDGGGASKQPVTQGNTAAANVTNNPKYQTTVNPTTATTPAKTNTTSSGYQSSDPMDYIRQNNPDAYSAYQASAGSGVSGSQGTGSGVIGSSLASAISQGAQSVLSGTSSGVSGNAGSGGAGGGGYPSGSGGSGGSSGSGSGNGGGLAQPDSTANPYEAAASTTNRITQGVDMTEQINAANEAWSNVNNNYGNTSQGLIDSAGQQSNEAIDTYANESQQIIDQLKGITDDAIASYAANTGQTIDAVKAQINDILAGLQGIDDAQAGRVDRVDTVEQENLLSQIIDAARQQQTNAIDYTTQQGITELQRAEEDAGGQFQTLRNQIAANEQTALDNQALYAEMRGDRGGIGQSQYGSIQNTAATNQLTVNREQTKLSTDTARQIADLRAQGEFKKADALLELTQSYLSQLMQLKQWAAETNVGIDEFNIGVEQWEEEFRMKARELLADTQLAATEYLTDLDLKNQQYTTEQTLAGAQQNASLNLSRSESLNQQRQDLSRYLTNLGISNAQYMSDNEINQIATILNNYMKNAENLASTEMSAANLTGAFSDATPTAAMAEKTREQLATAAASLIAAGLTPTQAQLEALGWTKDQYNQYKKALSSAASSGGGGGGTAGSKLLKDVQSMIAGGASQAEVSKFLSDYGYAYGQTEPNKVINYLGETGFFGQATGSTRSSGSSNGSNTAGSAVGNGIVNALGALGLPER